MLAAQFAGTHSRPSRLVDLLLPDRSGVVGLGSPLHGCVACWSGSVDLTHRFLPRSRTETTPLLGKSAKGIWTIFDGQSVIETREHAAFGGWRCSHAASPIFIFWSGDRKAGLRLQIPLGTVWRGATSGLVLSGTIHGRFAFTPLGSSLVEAWTLLSPMSARIIRRGIKSLLTIAVESGERSDAVISALTNPLNGWKSKDVQKLNYAESSVASRVRADGLVWLVGCALKSPQRCRFLVQPSELPCGMLRTNTSRIDHD